MGVVGIFKRLAHPLVHAHIEIGQDKDRCLQAFRKIEGFPAELEAFIDIAGKQNDGLRVTMPNGVTKVRSACDVRVGKPVRRTDALHIPDHDRHFGIIGQTREFGHQAQAGPGGGCHRAQSAPARADRHADGGQFIFGLHDGIGVFAIFAFASMGK